MKIKSIKEFRKYSVAPEKITRTTTTTDQSSTDPKEISGVAAVFNQPSKLLAELDNGQVVLFYEVLLPGCFDDVLASPDLDCIYCVDHSTKSTKMISRTKSGTLKLSVDEYGLNFGSETIDTSTCRDLIQHISKGNLTENSFCFVVDEDGEEWTKPDESGIRTRYIKRISGLYDVSTVITPAYYNTSLSLRGLEILKDMATEKQPVQDENGKVVEVIPMDNETDILDIDILLMKVN